MQRRTLARWVILLIVPMLSLPVVGQIKVKLTPEPMAVPLSQLSDAKQMGRWVVEGCNMGTFPVTLTQEQLSIAASDLQFIDGSDAALVLNSQARKTFWGYVKQYGSLAAQGVAIALAVSNGRANAPWVAGLGIGSAVLPQLVTIAGGQVPTGAALLTQLQWPITLAPNACFTDHRFAAKMKNPQPVVLTITK